jgi:hypothetical protein
MLRICLSLIVLLTALSAEARVCVIALAATRTKLMAELFQEDLALGTPAFVRIFKKSARGARRGHV